MSVVDIITLNFSCVICNCNFFNFVFNFFAGFVFRQICEIVFPVTCCSYCLTCIYISICKKIYCNACRTFSILVVVIIPVFYSVDGNGFWSVGVEDIVTIYCFSCCYIITCYWFFFYCVIDQLSFFFVLLKICKTVCPVSICIWSYFLRVNFYAICKEIDFNLIRADTVLVISIAPALCSTDRCCLISIGKFCFIYSSSIFLDNLIKSQSSIAIIMGCYTYSSGGYFII